MHSITNTELSSHEETRCQFNGGRCAIKMGIDVHQDFYVVVEQVGGTNPKPPQRFHKQAFLHWAAKLKQSGAEVHAVYEACGFGFTLQRQLAALGIHCHVVCPQKLDERSKTSSRGTERRTRLKGNKTTLERGRCPVPNLLRMPFACVGLDWARPYRPSGFGLPLPR